VVPQSSETGEDNQQPDPESMERLEEASKLGNQESNERDDDPATVASPRDLLEHLSRMSGSLELVWSEALDTEPAANAREEAIEVWQSFVAAFTRWTERMGQIEERLGLKRTIDSFPLDDSSLAQLQLDPDDTARRYYQLQIASMYAFQTLMESVKGLKDPTGQRVDLLAGQVSETWWEAGAFSLVKRRAAALARILREEENCLRELVRQSGKTEDVPTSVSPTLAWMDPLHSAADLISLGWHAAALPQLLLALRAVLAESAELVAEELPVPLAPRLRSVPRLASLETPISLLESTCRRLAEGEEVDRGVAVPLAEELLERVRALVFNPLPSESLSSLRMSDSD
jgi:hypothetical protein